MKGSRGRRSAPISRGTIPKTLGPSGGPITKDQTGVETYAHGVHDRRVAEGEGDDLVGLRRRVHPAHARRRQDVDERDAEGSRRLHARLAHRGVAARGRHGVRGGEPLPARRSPAVHLRHERLRQDVEADRRRDRRHRVRARGARGPGAEGTALRRHRARRLGLVRRRRALDSDCSATCRRCRCTISRSRTTIS